LNLAFFGENIFKLSSNFTITPGFRVEKIRTQANGSYRVINRDLAGNVILDKTQSENTIKDRNLLLLGVGLSYKPKNGIEFYGNLSQNYRSVTFSDIRTVNPSQKIDENITDEKGYTSDIGLRGHIGNKLSFDTSVFGLYYNDKIGDYDSTNTSNQIVKIRANTGTALTYGFETLLDWNIAKTYFEEKENFSWSLFTNSAITGSNYLKSDIPTIKKGDQVEFVPLYNIKTGTTVGYKNFITSVQFTYVSSQLSSASSNNLNNVFTGISGTIPSYYVADFSTSYKWNKWKLEAGVTNFTNNSYFTRRATGYPGPGIIPSDNRTFYTTLEFVF
jgi:Fe(3+) dicitrate transport protein